jgi:hypothetical protein
MRALFILVLVLSASCSSDPCAGRSGTCIALTVQGSASAVDVLAVTVDEPVRKTETTPPISLPITIGLNLPASVEGVVHIGVVATEHGAPVAYGDGQAIVSRNRGSAVVTLGSGMPTADMAPNRLGDLAGSDGFAPQLPGAPTNVVASSGNAQATVSWSPPADTGSSPITSYTITAMPSGTTMTTPGGTTTSATIMGLTNGTPYTFTVAATNAAGTGPAAMSNQATPTATPMAPSAPTNVMAVANVDHGATINWTASDNHGSPLLGYSITSSQLQGMGTLATAGPTMTSVVVTGLTPGMTYNFNVTATNAINMSNLSLASNNIVAATKPDGAPTNVMASANIVNGATVSWTAPATSGFSPVTKYTVMASPGGATATTPDGNTLSAQVTGLSAGTQYTFTVFASNVIGDGPASSASNAIIAAGKLPAPTGLIACGANGRINVAFNSVPGANSYDIFYSTASPATSGSKINVTGSPTTITVANGSYYVAVAAVNGSGDGSASAQMTALADPQVHDTLFVAEATANTVDLYDCYSQLPNQSAPSRSLTMPSGTAMGFSPIAVDPTNAIIYVSDANHLNVRMWWNATTVNGSPAADYTLTANGGAGGFGAIALDTTNRKLYAEGANGGTIVRYGYSKPSDLNGTRSQEVSFTTPITNMENALQLVANPATGALWAAFNGVNTSSGGVCIYAAASSVTASVPCTKQFLVTGQALETYYNGVAYSPASGGTLYMGTDSEVMWLTGVDSLAGGSYNATGWLATSVESLTLGGTTLAVLPIGASSPANGEILAWNTSNLTGDATKTVVSTNTHGSNGGVVYIP